MNLPGARRSVAFAAIGVPIIALTMVLSKGVPLGPPVDTSNYRVVFEKPEGWKEVPHGPQTIFLFRHPESNLLMRGAVSQMVADINPTPELDTEGIANFYIERTHDNMPDWTAKKSDRVDAKGTWFRLIERERKGKKVVTAYAVKGNTTVLVSLSGGEKEKPQLEGTMPEFKNYLASLGLEPTTIE